MDKVCEVCEGVMDVERRMWWTPIGPVCSERCVRKLETLRRGLCPSCEITRHREGS